MSAERQCLIMFLGLIALCLTILYVCLFIALWPYRAYVGGSLLALLVLLVLVFALGRLNEQALRRVRYHHHEEIPLDAYGEPHYWPKTAQMNPHRQTPPYYYQPYSPSSLYPYSPYQTYQEELPQ